MKYIKLYENYTNRKMTYDENKIYALSFSWKHLTGNIDNWIDKDLIIGKISPYLKDKFILIGYNIHVPEDKKGKQIKYVIENFNNIREATQNEIDFYWYFENMKKR